nr:hypothetical protein REQ54_01077 [Rhizobium sp. Q54]
MIASITAKDILDALIASSDDSIWASELAFFGLTRRIDFWEMKPVASQRFRASAYEIKISRADYARDSEKKQSGALMFSDRFWYVTPPGLLRKEELPEWAGLLEWDGTRFTTIRRAPVRRKQEPTWEFIASLMRNSGDCRRDIGLIKAQLAYFEMRDKETRRYRDLNNAMTMDRWLNRRPNRSQVRP